MSTRLGITDKLFLNTGGTYLSPTWTELKLVGDASVPAGWDRAEGPTRESRVKRGLPTLLDIGFTGKVRVDESNAGFTALDDAFHGATTVDVLVLNGGSADNGARGYRFDASVTKWDEDQALGAINFRDMELKPAISVNAPQRAVVTSGAPVFTAL